MAKSLASASAEIDQLKKKVAALEKELANAKEQAQKLQVCTLGCLRLPFSSGDHYICFQLELLHTLSRAAQQGFTAQHLILCCAG